MGVLKTRFGHRQAQYLYRQVCPVVGASIGQHVRHSMDHMELAARMATSKEDFELHYDLRTRGGDDEKDMEVAEQRVQSVCSLLREMETLLDEDVQRPVEACFMLSADPTEYHLTSTIEREMGFAAHHAIHHMAMVKIIATHSVGLKSHDLSPDFGRAPSTIVHDNREF